MEHAWIAELGLVLLAALLAGELCAALGASRVVGEIAAGALLGTHALGWVGASPPLAVLAELGVLLMIFGLGLETRLEQLRAVGAAAVAAAAGGVLLPLALGALCARAFGYPWPASLFLGAVLCATSIAVSTRVLIDLGLGRTRAARLILAAAVLDDVAGIAVLAAVAAATGVGGGGRSPGALAAGMAAFLGLGLPLAHALLPRAYAAARRQLGGGGAFGAALGAMLLCGWLAHAAGLEAILGAFFAGVALGRPPHGSELERDLEPLVRVLAPVFFASIGLALDPRALGENLPLALALGAVAVFSKVAGCGLPARCAGFGWRESALIGVGMVPRGEVGLIIAGLGRAAGVLDPGAFSAAAFVCAATILVAPPLLRALSRGGAGAPPGAGAGAPAPGA